MGENAKDYAERIAANLDLMESLSGLVDGPDDIRGDEQLAEYWGDDAENLAAYRAAIEDLGGWAEIEGQSVASKYFEDVLEIAYTLRGSLGHGSAELDSVEVLITFGGPNCRAITRDGQSFDVVVTWWGDSHTVYGVRAESLAEYAWSAVEDSLEA